MAGRNANSLETILTFENRDLSQWSVVWSTTHIPGMDAAIGRPRRREVGRRQLRLGSLVLGGLLTMHCRVAASAATGGLLAFLLVLLASVCVLANPMRHFEVYLGQWSISGPGRAFRIVPMLDGIGIAICINAIVRAICCCAIAAIAALYVMHSVSDIAMPFTYCRDFELNSYKPAIMDLNTMLRESRFSFKTGVLDDEEHQNTNMFSTTVGLSPYGWRNASLGSKRLLTNSLAEKEFEEFSLSNIKLEPNQYAVCKEKYSGNYPILYKSPAYNFFHVELVHLRDDYNFGEFNKQLIVSNVLIWSTIWAVLLSERCRYGKLIWNNIITWFVIIPVIWALVLSAAAITNLMNSKKTFRKLYKIGAKNLLTIIGDALEVALYVHSAGVGTEIILGKGLNHYASGHIDPHLNAENVWHSVLLVIVSSLHCIGAALCVLVDSTHLKSCTTSKMAESSLWIIPLYSQCTSSGNYSHFLTTLVFGGLVFSYMAVAFILLKTALHTIFEYRVKLVFLEQVIVGALILACMGLSLPFASNGGIALLESVETMMSGLATMMVCSLELFGLLYMYRSHDFVSDMNISQEDTSWPGRMEWQWRIIPLITLITICLKGIKLVSVEMPKKMVMIAIAPVLGVVLAVPLRAVHNAIVFLRPSPRHGT